MVLNQLKTIGLLAVLTALVLLLGSYFGEGGLIIAIVFAVLINGVSYFFSDKIVLAMYRAKEVTRDENKDLYDMVKRLADRAGLPMPRVYTIPSSTPNAFATGRNPKHAAVAFTEGILRLLNQDELEGVTAHELAHVKNRDVLISTIAAVFAGVVGYLATMLQWAAIFGGGDDDHGGLLGLLVAIIVAPLVAMLVQLAVSRTREYMADETGARLTRKPRSLASALRRIHDGVAHDPMEFGNEATAFLFIENPFRGRMSRALNWLSTHPPVEERIKRLNDLRF